METSVHMTENKGTTSLLSAARFANCYEGSVSFAVLMHMGLRF